MSTPTTMVNNPLVRYAERRFWGNPELDQQFQVHMEKISGDLGYSKTFNYMNKWRTLPKPDLFYHIFTVGGLHPGFWNWKKSFQTRNPLDRWINAANLSKLRGLQLDFYNTSGFMYPRSKVWVMICYDGLVLVAMERVNVIPVRLHTDMFFRCYTTTLNVDTGILAKEEVDNPFVYETMTYESPAEMSQFQGRYEQLKKRKGFTGVFHNGVFYNKAPNTLTPAVGDEVEIWHDPTVTKVMYFNYSGLKDYYSDMDKKRKVILHPPKEKDNWRFRYFDDNDYYLLGPTERGLYYHRNDETVVRQLTHVDVSLSDDQIRMAAAQLKDLNDLKKVRVMVLVRETNWRFDWPNESQRIRYLYRFDDAGIMMALTGQRANMPEWSASELEKGPVQTFIRQQAKGITVEGISKALGYNALTRVMSDSPRKVTYGPGQRGIRVGDPYQASYTAWEYDENGYLVDYWHLTNAPYFSPRHDRCKLVEFTVGKYGRKMDYVVSQSEVKLRPGYDIQVFYSKYSITEQRPVGELTNVTGTDFYKIENGYLHWLKMDEVNEIGFVLFNDQFLAYEFELDHIDHSLTFQLTHIYEDGGLVFPIGFANYDLFLNRKPLMDFVDWVYDEEDSRFYIHNREHLVDGPQKILLRAHGFHEDIKRPKEEVELGYVEGGVIGNFPRYNVRSDRVTRIVIGGHLMNSDDVKRAETTAPNDLYNIYNGRPYMVKHVYCPVKYVDDFNNYPGYKEAREVDGRVVDYLTKWLPKPKATVIKDMQDKYLVYSPFMNVIVNGILNNLIFLPAFEQGQTEYSHQQLEDVVGKYLWWLKFDPITMDFDRRYFDILPYANVPVQTVKPNELKFIKQVNDAYLDGKLSIEGNFKVK